MILNTIFMSVVIPRTRALGLHLAKNDKEHVDKEHSRR